MLFNIIANGKLTMEMLLSSIICAIVVVFLCWPVREWAKAFVATKLGDPTPGYQGRLSLNPFVHIDPIGAIAMVLFGIGWGKGDSYNPRYFKNYKRDTALVCLSGPLANIILGFVFFFFFKLFAGVLPVSEFSVYILLILRLVASINVTLAAFHLIPIPPLEASCLLPLVMSSRAYYNLMQYRQYISYGLILLLATGALSTPINFISSIFFKLFDIVTFFL